jgi:hypothetical protein
LTSAGEVSSGKSVMSDSFRLEVFERHSNETALERLAQGQFVERTLPHAHRGRAVTTG